MRQTHVHLRGKVATLVYHSGFGFSADVAIGESRLVDKNGTTVEPQHLQENDESNEEVDGARQRPSSDERNLEIEQNACWLAKMLDVPFED